MILQKVFELDKVMALKRCVQRVTGEDLRKLLVELKGGRGSRAARDTFPPEELTDGNYPNKASEFDKSIRCGSETSEKD